MTMLHLLAQYARDHELVAEPGFKPKQARWALFFSDDGRFLHVAEQGDPDERPKRGRTFGKCPDLSQPEIKRGGAGCRHFLLDTLEVVTLFGDSADDPKLRAKHDYFVELLKQAAPILPELELIAAALESEAVVAEIGRQLAEHAAKPTEHVTFAVMDREPPFLVDDPCWHEWWRGFRRSIADVNKPCDKKRKPKATVNEMRCFVSGEIVEPVPTHPKIEGLSDVGGLPMGDVLAAFKQESFCSYGLEQANNAAVSEELAASYRAALNHLIRNHGRSLAGAKVVHWYSGRTPIAPESDPLTLLEGDFSFLDDESDREAEERDAQRRARELLNSIHTGTRPDLADCRYYILVVSGNSGRVVVRAWNEGPFADLVANITRWFEDLEIVSLDGVRSPRTPGIERLVTALLPEQKSGQNRADWLKPVGSERTALLAAALSDALPIPRSALARVVLLNRLEHQKGDLGEELKDERNAPAVRARLYARMALMKAYHIRKGDKAMSASLNKEHSNPAYHCGRLLYVLARLQKEIMPEVKAGVIQRFYVSASTTPGLVFGRLIGNSSKHLTALGKEREGLARWFEHKVKEILAAIDAHTGGIPPTLNLEEQSLFALGYYHQMAETRDSEITADNGKENEHE
jgi:CRISPR-associated protein Csd1